MAVMTAMSGPRKAAILIMSLGEEASSQVFQHLQEDEIEKIAKEIASLGPVPSDMGERVLEEFQQLAEAANYVTNGGVEYARRLLTRSFGKEDADRILDRVVRSFRSTAGFATLEKTDPQQLSKF